MKTVILSVALCAGLMTSAMAQEKSAFKFEPVHNIKTTPVKTQDRTGTCWSFSTTSFIETEIIRQGGPEMNLSEMYFVRYAYPEKAHRYVMVHGKGNFSEGGQAHDVMNVLREHGMMTEDAFPGRREVSKPFNHAELASSQLVLLDNFIKQRNAAPCELWYETLDGVLNTYMGQLPDEVTFEGKSYTPQALAEKMTINADDYVELTSYSHHPWYSTFDLEIPDNWSHDQYYNLPLDDLMAVMDNALEKGYSFTWDGDVSEKFFSHKNGVALVPEVDSLGFVPQKEKMITQEDRQKAFLSWQSTDDHLMHITGLSKDQEGTHYYKTKNSWRDDSNDFGGYLYMSESFVRLHSVAIMVHRDAIPKEIAKKLFKK